MEDGKLFLNSTSMFSVVDVKCVLAQQMNKILINNTIEYN